MQIRNVVEYLPIRGVFLIFHIAFYRAVFFCRVLAIVYEALPRQSNRKKLFVS